MYNFSSPTQRNLPRSVGRTHGLAIGRDTRGIASSKVVLVAGTTVALMAWGPLSDEAAPQLSRCRGMGARLSNQANVMSSQVNAAQCGSSRNVPIPSSLYDVFQGGMPRLPAKKLPGFCRIGDEFRRVAGAPLHFLNRDSAPTHVLDCGDHLANGMPTSRAKINGSILVALEHVPKGRHVRLGQIHYMCIVADCRTVRGRVIRPVNIECWFLPQRCLNSEWNKMSFR